MVKWFQVPGSNPPFYHYLDMFSAVPNLLLCCLLRSQMGQLPTNWDSYVLLIIFVYLYTCTLYSQCHNYM